MNRRNFLKSLGIVGSGIALFPELVFGQDKKSIYLTIDDGPWKNMEKILENLGENKATFFMVGEHLEIKKYFDLACRTLDAGHKIGNHSYSHSHFSEIKFNQVKEEVEKAGELIQRVYDKVGIKYPLYFRFPFGDNGRFKGEKYKDKIDLFLKLKGYDTFGWNFSPREWEIYSKDYSNTEEKIMKSLEQIKDDDVVLIHDNEISAKKIIPYLIKQDYKFKLLGD